MLLYCVACKISMSIIQSWPGHDFFLEVIFACAFKRWMHVQRTVEEESVKLDQVARSTKRRGRWKFFMNGKGREQ